MRSQIDLAPPEDPSAQRKAWFAIIAFCLIIGALLLVRASSILTIVFPASAFIVGLYLFKSLPTFYISFVWWLTFLGPFIKRLIDYQSGYLTLGMFNFTPLLVSMIAIGTVLTYLPQAIQEKSLPFLLCMGSVIYSLLVGFIQDNSINALVNSALAWLAPLFLGFHLFIHWQDYPKYTRILQKTFLWGALVMGLYGIIQFLIAPEWDKFWLISLNYYSQGVPEPLGMRVWSTMTSAHDFGNVMMASLILLFCNIASPPLRISAMGMGYLSFLLTIARTVWLSWFVSLVTFIFIQKGKYQIRFIIGLLALSILVIPLTSIEPFSEVIQTRLESFSNLSDDVSYNARVGGYTDLLFSLLSNLFGQGLGSSVNVEDTTIAAWDSSILPTLAQMGVLGSIPYFVGTILPIMSIFQTKLSQFGAFEAALCAIILGIFAQLGLNFIFVGSTGMILWEFIGLALAASKYYRFRARSIAGYKFD